MPSTPDFLATLLAAAAPAFAELPFEQEPAGFTVELRKAAP